MKHPNKSLMTLCIESALEAYEFGDYALGALVVNSNNTIISRQFSRLFETPDPTAHPEIVAIRESAKKNNSRYLEGCYLYSTLEPCPMCTAAAIWAKMEGIVFGAYQKDVVKFSKKHKSDIYTWRQIRISSKYIIRRGKPKLKLYSGFMRQDCINLLKMYNVT